MIANKVWGEMVIIREVLGQCEIIGVVVRVEVMGMGMAMEMAVQVCCVVIWLV